MMKVIDLLNKIANGEKVPKTILYSKETYFYSEKLNDYYKYLDDEKIFNLFNYSVIDILNDEVEIIEEDKKIEKIKILNCDNYVKKENYETILTMQEIALDIQTLRHKLDEIIDYLEEKNNE